SVVDSKGILLARFPEPERWLGKHIPDASMFEILRLRTQATRELIGLDGVDRLYALKPLTANGAAGGQIYVMVGIPKSLAFGQVNRALTRNLIWLFVASLCAGAIAWFVGSKFVIDYVKVRVRAEEERARLAAIVESSEDAIIGMTLDGRITSWNDGAESTYGFAAAEMLGQSILQLIPADHHNEVPELLDVVKQGRGINRYESKRKRKDGQLFDVSASLSPIRDVHRNVVGAATITRDISLLRQGEERLLAYTHQLETLNLFSQEIAETLSMEEIIDRGLRRLLEASGFEFGLLYFSEEVNGRALYGVGRKSSSVDEIEAIWARLGKDFEECFWRCENPWFVEQVAATPEFASAPKDNPVKALAVLPLRQGPPLRAALALLSLREHSFSVDEGKFLHAMSRQVALAIENARLYSDTARANQDLRREIDERKRAEQTLADFTAMIAHDLRSPLSNVVTITDSMGEGVFGPINELQEKWLSKVRESCRSLIDQVSDFLDISKIDAGELQLTKAAADLKPLLEEVFLDHSMEAAKKRITFKTDVSDNLPELFVDVRRISQVLENLVSNAFKYTQTGGEISIGARPSGHGEALWWVKDSGVGISAEEFDHIFDKYRRVIGPQQSDRNGTGLGLAICKKIVEAHGGRIWVESEPDKGSTFFVTLPAITAAQPQELSIPA
ncbi:MAG TPA: ATP-binding protein, partial [Candidatus Binatia bacterium]|nr:ATP-binding protein [Candidatus Binatia bacterium]